MSIKQISVLLENKPGRLAKVSELLGKEGINIRAISVADTADFGIVRFIVDDTEKAMRILSTTGLPVKESEVIAVETPDHPGGLASVLKPLNEANINVEYLYTSLQHHGENAILIMKVDRMEEAIEVLKKNWFKIVEEEKFW